MMSDDHTQRRPKSDGLITTPEWRLRILIIEDDADTAHSLAELLAVYGFETRVELNGADGLLWARANHPDVILLDIGLPGSLDGHAVARELQRSGPEKPPLLIAMTGRDQEEDCARSAAAGIHLHLVKPVEPEQLEKLLRRFERIVMPGH